MRPIQHEGILPLIKLRKNIPDEEASIHIFEKYFEEYWTSIHRFLLRMVGDPAEAEDLALETFFRLYQRLPVPMQDINVRSWLYRVAANLGLHSLRSFKRRVQYELIGGRAEPEQNADNTPAAMFDAEEEKRMARQVLAGMKAQQSQLLLLRYTGMTYKDIASILNLSPTSIGPLLLRAEREFEKRYRASIQEEL